jgi:CDP-diacylglycerol--serine O-phosphatidyltransferase
MGFIWVMHSSGVPGREISFIALAVTVIAGCLMVSNVRYRSFKDLDLRGRVPFVAILALPLAFVLIVLDPPQVVFAVFAAYAVSGPVGWVMRLRRPEERLVEKPRT